jgi:predicted HTH transcriptional regulator
MRNTYKYTKMYSGGEPQFIEGNVFRITIPLSEIATATVGPGISGTTDEAGNEARNKAIQLSKNEKKILVEIRRNPYITKKEICLNAINTVNCEGFLMLCGIYRTCGRSWLQHLIIINGEISLK